MAVVGQAASWRLIPSTTVVLRTASGESVTPLSSRRRLVAVLLDFDPLAHFGLDGFGQQTLRADVLAAVLHSAQFKPKYAAP